MDLPSIILCFTVPSGSRIIESCVNFGSMRSKNLILRSNTGSLRAPVVLLEVLCPRSAVLSLSFVCFYSGRSCELILARRRHMLMQFWYVIHLVHPHRMHLSLTGSNDYAECFHASCE